MFNKFKNKTSLIPRINTFNPLMKIALSIFLIIVLNVILSSHINALSYNASGNEDLLEQLDELIADRKIYMDQRRAKADSVEVLINETMDKGRQLSLYLEQARLWSDISTDSTINVCNRGLHLSALESDSLYMQLFLVERASAFFNRGRVHDCIDDLNHVEKSGVMPGVERRFHYVGFATYITLGSFYEHRDQWTNYFVHGRKHLEAEKRYVGNDSSAYLYCDALINMVDGKKRMMVTSLKKMLEIADESDENYPFVNTILGEYFWETGNYDEAVYYYSKGAIANIRTANLSGVALMRLGEMLSLTNDKSRAYNYLAVSLDQALQGDMKFNLMRLNEAFMDVSSDIDKDRHHKLAILSGLVVVLIMLLVLVAKMIVNKRKEVKKLRAVEERLARANLAKETYITEFMGLCSSYIESLEDYNRLSRRKITAGQAEELLAYIKSGRIIDEQRRKFYEVFDEALLHIFPTYIEDVNKLLQPDKQIVLSSPGILTTELRVLALSRLGIDDAAVIARFLGISTNTIYTYRNKLRTRAVDRASFEEDAKKIGAF
ncbi:DUF6377 domain-containing protein [uncultured Duncaniella sp.]|uniref:DUF6377 domain-containing protein n=1 Tax=uncultured Duncaniella sp. TaxID=2768039 RepID=UPI0025A95CFC|nr:DUF6377 domain-containing protein [uncultured Duncaniella sp.]